MLPPALEDFGRRSMFPVGLAYLLILPLDIHLAGPIGLHDVLAPWMAFCLLTQIDMRRFLVLPDRLLAVFVALCLFTTCLHFQGIRDLYEVLVFAYVAFLYVFFSLWPAEPRWLRRYGVAVAATACAGAALRLLLGGFTVHQAYEGSTLAFLCRRLQLTFDNPNQLASFLVLPATCLAASIVLRPRTSFRREMRENGLPAMLLGLPLLLTASRHMILTAALALGTLAFRLPGRWRSRGTWCAWMGLTGIAILFYLTILFPFFPLQRQAPFFNHHTYGMYTIHQAAYWRLATLDRKAGLFGIGATAVHKLYPLVVDPHAARRILAEYRTENLLDSFLVYMDAHNEYLNMAVMFGMPAVLVVFLFFLALAANAGRSVVDRRTRLLPFLVAGIAVACLWDDLLSKRWIWISLGILASRVPESMAGHSPGEAETLSSGDGIPAAEAT